MIVVGERARVPVGFKKGVTGWVLAPSVVHRSSSALDADSGRSATGAVAVARRPFKLRLADYIRKVAAVSAQQTGDEWRARLLGPPQATKANTPLYPHGHCGHGGETMLFNMHSLLSKSTCAAMPVQPLLYGTSPHSGKLSFLVRLSRVAKLQSSRWLLLWFSSCACSRHREHDFVIMCACAS